MRIIDGFPSHIAAVPESPVSPDDREWDAKRQAWEAWSVEVMRYRVARKARIEQDERLRVTERAYCARDPAYWLLMWGWVFEPRPERDRAPESPFLLYPFQIDTLDWFSARLADTGAAADGVVSKSRDMGASWLMAAYALWGWLFEHPWQVRLVSWRADEVDARNPDSIFWKIDFLLHRLPLWMKPAKFDPEVHRAKMLLLNPDNGNVIGGQASTERAMRGGRATWVGYDEAAINKLFEESWSGTANVTQHRFAVSSEHLQFNDFFYRLRCGTDMDEDERPAVLELDYWLHPKHDEAWVDSQRKRNSASPGAFEREVLRNPKAGDTTFVYPQAMDKFPVHVEMVAGAPVYVGIDPGFSDETAVVWELLHPDGHMKVVNAYQAKGRTADFWGTILRGTPYMRIKTFAITPEQRRWFDTGLISGIRDEDLPKGWERVGMGANDDHWSYSNTEVALMDWVRSLPQPTYYGDISGNSSLGATKDTVYGRLRSFDILVNTDHDSKGKKTATRMAARTFRGRQEAMKEQLARLDFADNPGGRLALHALQEYRWQDNDKARASEPRAPLHNAASHLSTAMEYIAVNLHLRRQMHAKPLTEPYRAGRTARSMGRRLFGNG